MSVRQENATVNKGSGDQEFSVGNPGSNLTTSENLVNVKMSERCFNERMKGCTGKWVMLSTLSKIGFRTQF